MKGEFSIHPKKFGPEIAALAEELLVIGGTGDYTRAGELLKKRGVGPAA